MPTDVLIRVLAATGHRAEVRVKKAAPSPIICRWKYATCSPSFRWSGLKKPCGRTFDQDAPAFSKQDDQLAVSQPRTLKQLFLNKSS